MEVFIRGAPPRATENQFSNFMRPFLSELNIHDWQCDKPKQKAFAFLTFLNVKDGERFLALHGQAQNALGGLHLPTTRSQITYFGTPLLCCRSKRQAAPLALKSLEMESKARLKAKQTATQSGTDTQPKSGSGLLKIVSVSCGVWAYRNSKPAFTSYFDWDVPGTLKFGSKMAIASLENGLRINFGFSTIREVNLEGLPQSAITMTLAETPHFLQRKSNDGGSSQQNNYQPTWTRISCLNSQHEMMSGMCLVYRMRLEPASIDQQKRAMGRAQGILFPLSRHVETVLPTASYKVEMHTFLQRLEALSQNRQPLFLPFIVKFQLQKLVQNAILPPQTVHQLLPEVDKILTRAGPRICADAIRRLSKQLPYRRLEVDATEADLAAIVDKLRENEDRLREEDVHEHQKADLEDRAYIHRVTFSPTGMYLYGPDPENNNRVLRRYRQNHESFARVVFCDENGEPIRFSPQWSNDVLYNVRFKRILNDGFSVAGRRYNFLGFSHSSLRAQSCWFMAPFLHEGSLMFDRKLIQGLGDFSKIRCPAKCAARIGQAFSETPVAITVGKGVTQVVPDIERNGRIFSDGVGTISQALLEKLWTALPVERRGKPRAFQIRYSGAKGMIALDSRLSGEKMILRNSMIKFPGHGSLDIEICETAYRPLPYFLNHQTIKILEDMGVNESFFFFHQKKEVDRLQLTASSPARASDFLKSHAIGDVIHLPWFIKELSNMNLSFRHDTFLRHIIEMAVLADLRALKYKARIPVKEGYTLHGILDETGVLEEGQVFCIVQEDGSAKVITGYNLVISRSPALHPGDVRTVTGVRVPDESPLMQLRNCICFSAKGKRDLPSQLSGGDLDGDLYQILFDRQALPKRVFPPADYPRVEPADLGRAVEREDMTDFFITFMATDQLGRIANLHKILADQRLDDGVLDSDCIKLAELHSTAVDFSKSGIPVDLTKIPRSNQFRPDFMATGPHAIVQKSMPLALAADQDPRDDEDEDGHRYKFYESPKILGKLFRAVDERQILSTVQDNSLGYASSGEHSVLRDIWKYIQNRCQLRQCQLPRWQRHVATARGIRDEYETIVHDHALSFGSFSQPLSEYEVFIGNILGKTGAQSKRQHDYSVTMKETFREDLRYIVSRILAEETHGLEHGLEISLACLAVALETESSQDTRREFKETLVSFGYVAASICLRRLQQWTPYSGAAYVGGIRSIAIR